MYTYLIAVGLLLLTGSSQPERIQWAHQRLTVRAVDAPFRELIEEVARHTGLLVAGTDKLNGRRSVEFRSLSLIESLPRLLEGVNYLVTSRGDALLVHIHSMSGEARPPAAGSGPIVIRGLSELTPEYYVTYSDPEAEEAEDEEEQEELGEVERAVTTGGPDALARLIAAVRSEFPTVRIRALRGLGGADTAVAIPLLTAALRDEDADVARWAADVLAAMPDQAALDALARQLAPGADVDAQFAALRGLALRADLRSIPSIRRATAEAHPLLRGFAVLLLQELEARERAARVATGKD
jgi:hypothetical protein